MIALVGENEHHSYNKIQFNDYLKATSPAFPIPSTKQNKIAIIVAKGTILDGNQNPGTIGGNTTAKYLRKARLDDQVKAVVLRVDSPGGSAFASDIIRQEMDLLKAAGKKVVASMGTYAASGGYWISAPADKIIASPTTITGSIGIFGFFMTFENSLSKLGVFTDGVGTTDIAGFGVTRPLSSGMSKIFQMGIEHGYHDFLSLVAKNRGMTIEQVDAVAQGRVWSGAKAKTLGLVDELGNLEDAVNEAALLAGLDNYDVVVIEKEKSPQDIFIENLFGQAAQYFPTQVKTSKGAFDKMLKALALQYNTLNTLNDPQGIYAFCLVCEMH